MIQLGDLCYSRDGKVLAVSSLNYDPSVSAAAELMFQGKMPTGAQIKLVLLLTVGVRFDYCLLMCSLYVGATLTCSRTCSSH